MTRVTFPVPRKPSGKRRQMRKGGYPWDAWFGKRRFTLHRGVDYACRTDSMRQMVYFASRDRGIKVSVATAFDEASLTVTVLEDG